MAVGATRAGTGEVPMPMGAAAQEKAAERQAAAQMMEAEKWVAAQMKEAEK